MVHGIFNESIQCMAIIQIIYSYFVALYVYKHVHDTCENYMYRKSQISCKSLNINSQQFIIVVVLIK